MASTSPDSTDAGSTDTPPISTRYAAIRLADGRVVVYDREDHDAWIEADNAIGREASA